MHTVTRLCMHALRAVVLVLLACSAAMAAVPDPPQGLRAYQSAPVFGAPTWVQLTWAGWDGSGEEPDGYIIYRAAGIQNQPVGFDSIGYVDGTLRGDTSRQPQFDLTIESGEFSFYVTAVNSDGASAPSNIVTVNALPLPATIEFTSRPEGGIDSTNFDSAAIYASIGVEFSYDADAVASNGGAVRYSLLQRPQGMTIDANTGEIHWTPTELGVEYIAIRAELISDPRVWATQTFRVFVRNCQTPGILMGRVVDENNLPVANARIDADLTTPRVGRPLSTTTNAQGYFLVHADAGGYVVHIQGTDIVAEWYQDAYDRSLSDTVNITCGDSTYLDIQVTRLTPDQNYTISGRVTSKQGNQPIEHALVQITGYARSVPDSVKWETRVDHATYTDANGEYSISLSDRYAYTVSVSVERDSSQSGTPVYVTQYYDGTEDPALATSIVLTGDRSNINFELNRLQPHNNSIRGFVRDFGGNGGAVQAIVVAYRVSSQGNNATAELVQSTSTGLRGGWFTFNSLPPGDYVLFATPLNRVNAPGYYVANAPAATTWDQGTRITVRNEHDYDSYEILLRRRDGLGGRTILRGAITTTSGHTIKVDRTIAGAMPVPGAMVLALDPQNRIATYTFSGPDGKFVLDGLGAGQYTVIADKVGYGFYQERSTFSGEAETINRDVTMESLQASGVEPESPVGTARIAAYPNPASTSVMLRASGLAGDVRLTVADVHGRQVIARELKGVDAAEGYSLDLAGLPAGLYLVRLQEGATSLTTTVTVVR